MLANLADIWMGMGDPAGHDIAVALRSLEKLLVVATAAQNARMGGAFEAAVIKALGGVEKNTKLLPPGMHSIPDIVDPAAKTITEIKSGLYVYRSAQIRKQIDGALAMGWRYKLIVGMNTRVSQQLVDAVRKSGGEVRRYDVMNNTFSPY